MRLKETVHSSKNSRIQESAFDAKSIEAALESKAPDKMLPLPKDRVKPTSFWQRLFQGWNNVSFQSKLILLLLVSVGLPTIVVTQGLITLNRQQQLRQLKESLQKDGKSFTEEYVLWSQLESQAQAQNLAKLVQTAEVDLSNPTNVSSRRTLLRNFLKFENGLDPEVNKSFQIFTDAQGRTVAQDIQILEDSSSTPPLPAKNEELIAPEYRSVSVPLGIYLGDIPIVKNSLSTGRPLSGMELLKREPLQRLGLEKQADIGLRTQPNNNLTKLKQPSPEGTYDIDGGKVGLTSMAVYPIKINNKLVGTVIVGALLNRNYGLVDKFSKNYNVSVATVFAQDWRVATNIPYTDGKTRAIGTRAAQEVTAAALNQGQNFTGQTNVVGQQYFTFYRPLYDHQQELNPTQAKPVGMAFIGESLLEVESSINNQRLIAYGIGGSMLLLAGLLALPIAASFSDPLRRLSGFAQRVGAGQRGLRLESTERQDEIGVLSQEMNKMAASIETNLEAVRRQEELRLQEQEKATRQQTENAQQQKLAKEQLQRRALELLMEVDPISRGDLTIRASVTEDEIGTIADSYNATVGSLRKIVTQVQTAAQKMAATTSSSEASVQELSTEALRQTEEIAVALDRIQEMSNSIRAVAKNAEQAEAAVQQANQTVEAGEAAMNRTVDGILAIRETVADTSTKVQRLGEASQKISKVVNLIGRFAAQTNLLALKASIEAARAGEEGRGFAILADEVRMLASQSAQATTEIESLVTAIQTETNEVAAAMEAGTEQVVEGTRLVDETRQSLNNITAASAQIGALVEAIASAAVTQSQTSESVTQTMSGVAAISNQTSNEATQVTASFKELLEVAQELQASAAQFKVS